MGTQEIRAIDAIWQQELGSSEDKLVLYHLTSKHELGERFSSAWKPLPNFLQDFEDRWCNINDIKKGTRLSEVKLNRILEGLKNTGYIKSSLKPIKNCSKKKIRDNLLPREVVYAVTEKLFQEFGQRVTGESLKKSA